MFTKKLILYLVIILSHIQFSTLLSQILVTINPPPPNQLKVESQWNVTLTNSTSNQFEVFLDIAIDDGLWRFGATTKIFLLQPGLTKLNLQSISPITVNHIDKKYEEIFIRTGNPPDGEYELCIKVKRAKDNHELGEGCIIYRIRQFNPPELIDPVNDKYLTEVESKNIFFQWLPSTQLPNEQGLNYKIKIVELFPTQNSEVAIKNNQVWFEQSELKSPQFNYPLTAPKFNEGSSYAWVIYTLQNDQQVSESEVWTFTIAPHPKYISKIQLISPENNRSVHVSDPEGDWLDIDFKWNSPETDLRNILQFKLKIVEVNKNQLIQEAIKVNPTWFEKDGIKNTEYKYSSKNKAFDKNKTYSWQVYAVLESGEIIPSEVFSFTCSVESTTVTSCGWPTLTNEFPIKSGSSDELLNGWPPTISTPAYVIPGFQADEVWGGAIGCFDASLWPPTSNICWWHDLYERGACWISPNSEIWNNSRTLAQYIFRKNINLSTDVENVRLFIASDDRVDVYIDPDPTSGLSPINPLANFVVQDNNYRPPAVSYSLPNLFSGRHEIVMVLNNFQANACGFIYGIEYDEVLISEVPEELEPPEISVPEPRRTLCVDSETGTFEVRAGLTGRINRSCTTMTFSQPDGTGSSLIYTTAPPTPNLNIEDLGMGDGERRYSIFIRENASDFLRNLNGYSKFCDTVLVTIRAGNSDCSRFSEYSWTMIIDADNRRPEINFITPTITPTTINTFVEHSPRTDPPTYDLIPCTSTDGCYCIPFPIPATFDIDILWASGLNPESMMLEVVFERQDPSPPHLISVQQLFDISRGGPLSFSLTDIANGKRLSLNSSLISASLPELQVGDCVKFIFHFPDSPCFCPSGYHQQSFKLKLGCP